MDTDELPDAIETFCEVIAKNESELRLRETGVLSEIFSGMPRWDPEADELLPEVAVYCSNGDFGGPSITEKRDQVSRELDRIQRRDRCSRKEASNTWLRQHEEAKELFRRNHIISTTPIKK